jgi:hypothetical protein
MARDGHVVSLVEPKGACGRFIWKPEEKNNMVDVDVYGRIMLKWI